MADSPQKHYAIYVKNSVDKTKLVSELLNGKRSADLTGQKVALFSKTELERYIREEDRHDHKIITKDTPQALISMSSGEQKKALLRHIFNSGPDYILLDDPFDNLDADSQKELRTALSAISKDVQIIQLLSRKADLLPFVKHIATLNEQGTVVLTKTELSLPTNETSGFDALKGRIPEPLTPNSPKNESLISFKNVSVHYDGKPILNALNWEVKAGEFWQLIGKNGSGKTTMLTMITGDNPKGYGQDLYIFDQKKGSGESVWDIKRRIGYFTPSMTHKFTGYHTVEYMLLSGFYDSVGLYTPPTEHQLRLAKEWLLLIGMWKLKNMPFHNLSTGRQRLLMVVRAMIKHPLVLILDEPTAGLDDESAALFVALVNKIALMGTTAIIFVSHREEPGLKPQFTYELIMTDQGSVGRAK